MNSHSSLDLLLSLVALIFLAFAVYVPVTAFRMRKRFSKEGGIVVVFVSIAFLVGAVFSLIVVGRHLRSSQGVHRLQYTNASLAGPHLSGGQTVVDDQRYGLITIVRRERNRIKVKLAGERETRRRIADLISQIPDADPAPEPSFVPAR